jgi:type I restriction enzyme M protein
MNKIEEAHFSRVVTTADIEAENFNLSVSTYVEQEDTREDVNIEELNTRISEIVKRQNTLRSEIDDIIKELEEDAA